MVKVISHILILSVFGYTKSVKGRFATRINVDLAEFDQPDVVKHVFENLNSIMCAAICKFHFVNMKTFCITSSSECIISDASFPPGFDDGSPSTGNSCYSFAEPLIDYGMSRESYFWIILNDKIFGYYENQDLLSTTNMKPFLLEIITLHLSFLHLTDAAIATCTSNPCCPSPFVSQSGVGCLYTPDETRNWIGAKSTCESLWPTATLYYREIKSFDPAYGFYYTPRCK